MKSPVFIVSGTPGSGKSSVSVALMRHFEFGLHIPTDDLRDWVVSGVAYPIPKVRPETERQFTLARSAAQLANIYAAAGFAVAIDDVIDPQNAATLIEHPLSPLPVYKVLLRPDLSETLKRNIERTHKAFDTTILVDAIKRIYNEQNLESYQAENWLILDSSRFTVYETVKYILSHFELQSAALTSD